MNRSTGTLAVLILVAATGSLFAQSPTRAVPREFSHVRTLGRALSAFTDNRIQVAAAYYDSQANHDSRWLLIELGALGEQETTFKRDQIELFESPTGLWDKGTYALVVRYDGADAVLPIELR